MYNKIMMMIKCLYNISSFFQFISLSYVETLRYLLGFIGVCKGLNRFSLNLINSLFAIFIGNLLEAVEDFIIFPVFAIFL